jgi:hypothetical protein
MILQLDPQIPVDTPKGPGFATLVIDNGQDHDLQWVVFIDATRECWTFRNPDIRLQKNLTMQRNWKK